MPHHLLTIPSEIRLRILEYAVTIDPIIICDSHLWHGPHGVPQRGVRSNPNVALHLSCSQIYGELEDIDVPGLDLIMCKPGCVVKYFARWPLMKGRIESIEASFWFSARRDENSEQCTKELLSNLDDWTSEAQVYIFDFEIQQNTHSLDVVHGKIVYEQ